MIDIEQIRGLLHNPANWETSEQTAFNRGYIIGLLEKDMEYSIVGSEPNEPNFDKTVKAV